jgi:hypothetical protein
MSESSVTYLKRPSPDRTRPLRARGNLYRTDDNAKGGLGGVTLGAAEDAMVAAVRMAYDIADGQIARSKRLADRLKGAADRVAGNDPEEGGQKSAEDAVDAASRLVNNAMLSGMTWVEALMGAEDGLAPRLAAAQLKAAKNVLFGTREGRAGATDPDTDPEPRPAASRPAASQRPTLPDVRIVLGGAKAARRPITIRRWDVRRLIDAELYFHPVKGGAGTAQVTGEIADANQALPTLRMALVPHDAPLGRWRAAICDAEGEQYGVIEIEI